MTEDKIIKKHLEQLLFDIKRGLLQYNVLKLLDEGPQYAYELKNDIYRLTDGVFDIDRNNLYKKLRILEQEGILKSTEKKSKMGANRKYYSLTPFGKKVFKEIQQLLTPVIDSFHKGIHNDS